VPIGPVIARAILRNFLMLAICEASPDSGLLNGVIYWPEGLHGALQ
jgi:hypothetical protein